MFVVNEDKSIYATRGDVVFFNVKAKENDVPHIFAIGDVLRIRIFEKKNTAAVVLDKCFTVEESSDGYVMLLTGKDTKFGNVTRKPVDYWYEIELNPYTNPQTIIGYDDDGPKIFRVYPEGIVSGEPVPGDGTTSLDDPTDLMGVISEINPNAVDKTLTVEGASADAKAVGDAIEKLKTEDIYNAKVAADNAQTAADNAQTAADNAQTAADNAQTTANNNALKLADKAETENYKGTFLATGWSASAPFTQEITVEGLLSTDYPFVDIDLSEAADAMSVIEGWNLVGRVTVSADNTLIAYAYEEAPAVDISIILKVVR